MAVKKIQFLKKIDCSYTSLSQNFTFSFSNLDNCGKRLYVPERAFAIEKGVGDL